MSDDLEAFLRQAARRRAAKKRPRIELIDEPIAEAEIVESKPPRVSPTAPPPATQAEPPSHFETRAAELGKTVGLADDLLEARLHETFDHQVGGLRRRSSNVQPVTPRLDPDSEIAKLVRILRDPASLRQAVLLREIIDRPEHRW
jgi:hypothetical protein